MGLAKGNESSAVYLEVKHYGLWQDLKSPREGSTTLEVNNPRTGEKVTKHGFLFRSLTGRAVALKKYDTGDKFSTRYFGFKLHVRDGEDLFVLDMPYRSAILRRFLRVAPAIDWRRPFTIAVFKGKKKHATSSEETGVWFTQNDETVKPYFTREQPRGMPQAKQDPMSHDWDFREQHSWLVARLQAETIPNIQAAAEFVNPPVEPEHTPEPERDMNAGPDHDFGGLGITDDDVPF